MKSILIAIVCLAVGVNGLTPEQKEAVKVSFRECIASTGAKAEDVHKSRQGQFVDDPKVGEFVFCFFKRSGFMNEQGELQIEIVKQKISSDLSADDLTKVVEKCSTITGKDNHEKAYNIYKCYWNATPNHINLTD